MSDHEGDARAERKAALAKRQAFAAEPVSAFVRVLQDGMAQYLAARKAGVERVDALKGLEEVVRQTWTRPPTKFPPVCDACEDVGWVDRMCEEGARCERRGGSAGKWNCHQMDASWTHRYVEPCVCVKGQQVNGRLEVDVLDRLREVGRQKRKPGGFKRLGG